MESVIGKEVKDWAKRCRGARRKAQPLRAGQIMRPKKGRGARYTRKQKHKVDYDG